MFTDIEEKLEHDANAALQNDAASWGRNFAVEFRKLYDSAFPVLFRVAYRITNSAEAAEDLCQESFFRLYEKNMVFPNSNEATYWLIRVVKNAALNYAKRKQRECRAYQKA